MMWVDPQKKKYKFSVGLDQKKFGYTLRHPWIIYNKITFNNNFEGNIDP